MPEGHIRPGVRVGALGTVRGPIAAGRVDRQPPAPVGRQGRGAPRAAQWGDRPRPERHGLEQGGLAAAHLAGRACARVARDQLERVAHPYREALTRRTGHLQRVALTGAARAEPHHLAAAGVLGLEALGGEVARALGAVGAASTAERSWKPRRRPRTYLPRHPCPKGK